MSGLLFIQCHQCNKKLRERKLREGSQGGPTAREYLGRTSGSYRCKHQLPSQGPTRPHTLLRLSNTAEGATVCRSQPPVHRPYVQPVHTLRQVVKHDAPNLPRHSRLRQKHTATAPRASHVPHGHVQGGIWPTYALHRATTATATPAPMAPAASMDHESASLQVSR